MLIPFGRGAQDMSTQIKRDKSKNFNATEETPTKSTWRKYLNGEVIVPTIVATILASIIISALSKLALPNENSKRIDKLGQDFNTLRDDFNKYQEETTSTLNALTEKVNNIETSLSNLDGRFEMFTKIVPSVNYSDAFQPQRNKSSGILQMSNPSWSSDDIIALDFDTEQPYTAHDLSDKKILYSYNSDDGEVYFYGKFNQNNHWDGQCTINVYKDNKLRLITDATYNDGNLVDYKQVLNYDTKAGADVWCVSERYCTENYNKGRSWNYYKDFEYEKTFNPSSVLNMFILNVDQFRQVIQTPLEAFYSGSTLNGSYNDNTGDAYLIKFDKNGMVKTLYKGNFSEGAFNDETGEAWYITRNEDSPYTYYKGKFTDGKPVYGDDRQIVTIPDIHNIIKDYSFECKLIWYGDTDTDI